MAEYITVVDDTRKVGSYRRKQQPVFPKAYYQIMVCKRIAQTDKKVALAAIRQYHMSQTSGMSVGYDGDALSMLSMFSWSRSIHGREFWENKIYRPLHASN